MKIGDALREGAVQLACMPQATPRLETELLLMEATGLSRVQLIAWPDRALRPTALAKFRSLLERRLAGEPVAYIRGHQAFWTLELRVTPDTLIPRPESELLVEIALEQLPAEEHLTVADAGTGSGAIAAALACERPNWTLIAVEHQAGATRVAADNLRHYAPENTRILRGDWLSPFSKGSLHAVIGNPPYIREEDSHLVQGDLPFEPRFALAAGQDGLKAIQVIVSESAYCLRKGGLLALEHGFDQGPAIRNVLSAEGFRGIQTYRDLAGVERATLGRP